MLIDVKTPAELQGLQDIWKDPEDDLYRGQYRRTNLNTNETVTLGTQNLFVSPGYSVVKGRWLTLASGSTAVLEGKRWLNQFDDNIGSPFVNTLNDGVYALVGQVRDETTGEIFNRMITDVVTDNSLFFNFPVYGLGGEDTVEDYYDSIFDPFDQDIGGFFALKQGVTGTKLDIDLNNNRVRTNTNGNKKLKEVSAQLSPAGTYSDNDLQSGFTIDPSETEDTFTFTNIVLEPNWEIHIGNRQTKEVFSVTYNTNGLVRASHKTRLTWFPAGSATTDTHLIGSEGGSYRIPPYDSLGSTAVQIKIPRLPLQKGVPHRIRYRRIPTVLGNIQPFGQVSNFGGMNFLLRVP